MLLDVEKEAYNEVYQDTCAIYSICHRGEDVNCLYFGDEVGELKLFDVRASAPSLSWGLHGDTINTIHCKPNNPIIIATSSADKTVSLWDLRSVSKDQPKSLTSISHGGPIYSAYFSPFGTFLATTSSDNTIGLYGGENYQEKFLIPHNNLSGEYISTLRGIWGWDNSHLYIGKIQEKQKHKRKSKIDDEIHGLHIISTVDKKVVCTLQSDDMPTVPYRLAAHPYIVGTLAGATGKGKVCMWAQA
ncbi:DNA damage-binding protein cmr1-like [Lycium barbarum]|uniref:DNA damage-binding protein cmr1-like n=1 Tax=Lycium barbarum TaxID=112863 RepID=UPI00293F5380|nr:DNA damage-binding protein cmr1-like [Lycium barbarum]